VNPKEFVPTPESVLALIHPDDRETFLRHRKKAIAEHRRLAMLCERGDTRAASAALLAHLDAAQAAMRKSRPAAAGKVTRRGKD